MCPSTHFTSFPPDFAVFPDRNGSTWRRANQGQARQFCEELMNPEKRGAASTDLASGGPPPWGLLGPWPGRGAAVASAGWAQAAPAGHGLPSVGRGQRPPAPRRPLPTAEPPRRSVAAAGVEPHPCPAVWALAVTNVPSQRGEGASPFPFPPLLSVATFPPPVPASPTHPRWDGHGIKTSPTPAKNGEGETALRACRWGRRCPAGRTAACRLPRGHLV